MWLSLFLTSAMISLVLCVAAVMLEAGEQPGMGGHRERDHG
jgi:hypothetical protein